MLVLALFGAWAFREKPEWLGDGAALLDAPFWSLILLDVFWVLRKGNVLSRGRTALCLALILPVSGACPVAKLLKTFLFEV